MNRAVAICLAAGLWVLPVALSAGCGGDDDDGGHDDDHDGGDHHKEDVGPNSGATCPDDSKLTYANFGENFFKSYCLRCHSKNVTGDKRMGAPADHNFDTLAEIELVAMHIDQKAAAGPDSTNEAMPPSNPKPSLDDRKKLGEWLECGLPE
ncbi:MAG TPA: hypothetical protein VJV78_01910 [Polyangiales bacterium]|nr:hypothetical protein [Polyangiales bacterium]